MNIPITEEFFISIVVSTVPGKQSGECIVPHCVCRLGSRMASCQGGAAVKTCGPHNGHGLQLL